MYDFGFASMQKEEYNASIDRFIDFSLNMKYSNPTILDRIKLRIFRVNIEKYETDNRSEIVKVFKGKKLIAESEFKLW